MRKSVIVGAGVAGLATWAAYQCYSPRSQVWGRTFFGLDRFTPLMALTYDDGPNDPWTLRLLEVLEQHAVKATFFLIGRFVEQKPEIARAIVAAGHEVGIHTWDHPNLIFATPAEVRSQIERTRKVIFETTGVEPMLFRPPFGARTPITLSVVRRLGLTPVMWNVTCRDWERKTSPQSIMKLVARQARGGDIILLHDGHHRRMGADRSASVEATKQIIRKYKDRDYRFLTISEMMRQA